VPARATSTVALEPSAAALDPNSALARGISLNHKGLNVEASRLLNDALSRLPASAAPVTRAELLLEAGLADSNIRFSDSAQAHFGAADRIFADVPAARTPLLARKRETYGALEALNRGAFAEVLVALNRTARVNTVAENALSDAQTLRALNQPRAGGVGALAVPDVSVLSQIVLDAQDNYARSVALLAQGDAAASSAAIEAARASYRPLSNERLDQAQLWWLGARIDRQQGRLLARQGRYGDALDNFDRAVEAMRRGAVATAGTGNEPAIAEAELERAAIYARTGASRENVRRTFATAIDALIASGSSSLGGSIGMEDYLDLLVGEAATPKVDTFDRFFRAVQASGEPATARQLTQLRDIVTADPALGRVVRERADLEREITRLRYAIAGRSDETAAPVADLERARAAAEARLLQVDAQLAGDPRYRTVDETPATLAELRTSLRPGESYFKLTALNRRIYGMVVTGDRTFIYRVADSAAAKRAVDTLASEVRASIDGRLASGTLVPFDEARAYTLFRLVTGPAADAITGSRALVADPAGPLERLPLGVLVTRYDRNAPAKADPFDHSQTPFLARSASISTALSPRSFLVARALPPSRAARPFLGLGQHRPAGTVSPQMANAVATDYGCTIEPGRLQTISRRLVPISGRELSIAAGALGTGTAPTIIDAAFSDTGLRQRTDLDQFEVLHFATHGLEEGVWGCTKSPPALVTSFGDAGSDGLLSFSEIAALRLNANLVVLSACDTASGVRDGSVARAGGQEESGSTLEGLVRAFLTANARAVLATHWQVSAEKESDEFVRTFYARGRTGTMGEALQGAQTALIAQPAYSHPFYWGSYFLVGDSSKTMLSGAAARQVASR
jgi:tetratricopeptide (TPR) repeat protein